MKKYLLIIAIILLADKMFCQSINKSWYCEDDFNLCITFNEDGYSTIDELEFIKYKIKKDKLIIVQKYAPGCFSQRTKHSFQINKLSEDTLILIQNNIVNKFEHMTNDTTILVSSSEGCR